MTLAPSLAWASHLHVDVGPDPDRDFDFVFEFDVGSVASSQISLAFHCHV